MRMMLRFSFPVQSGNEVIRSEKIGRVFEQLAADLKPEAAYFHPVNGERGGTYVFDMEDSSGVAGAVERLKFGLNADVELTPVMTAADLQRGLGDIGAVIKNYG